MITGVPSWLTGWRPADPDPQRSWDMDPPPPSDGIPSHEDAQAARLYKLQYGDPNMPYISNETRMSKEAPDSRLLNRLNSDKVFTDPTPPTPIGWDRADAMTAAQMAANTSPVAALGFDTSKMSYTPDKDYSVRGMTDPDTGRMWFSESAPSTPVHEAMHAGHMAMRDDPEGKALMQKLSHTGREWMVRADMQRRFGPEVELNPDDVEGRAQFRSGKADKDAIGVRQMLEARERLGDPEWRKRMREIDRVAHRMNAERLLAREGAIK